MPQLASPPRPDRGDADAPDRGVPRLMKVALAVAGPAIPAWQLDCIEAIRSVGGIDVRVVAVGDRPPRASRLAGPAFKPVAVACDATTLAGADAVVDLSGGDVAVDAPLGVWSLRFDDSDDPELPFGREIAAGAATLQIALVRRIGERRERVKTARVALGRWYPSMLRLALRAASAWPAAYLAALRDGLPVPAEGDDAPRTRAPLGAFEQAAFLGALARRLVREALDTCFEIVEWNVGFVEGGARALLSGAPLRVRWLARPRRKTFVADPFVVERDGVRAMLVEHFDYAVGHGTIDALVLDEAGNVVERLRAIEAGTHLSYPYPIEDDGQLYVVPENCAAKQVALYRCVAFPDRWERETVLFPFDGVDTTIFRHDERWWAFCTRHSHGSTLALHAFHAASLRGPWLPHALNPIAIDVTCARPAGAPFVVDGVLYRPGQDCARSYGAALAIARIDELTPWSYRETVVRRIDPSSFGRWNAGVHTLSFSRGEAVIDGKHVYRDPRKLGWVGRRLREKLRRSLDRARIGRTRLA